MGLELRRATWDDRWRLLRWRREDEDVDWWRRLEAAPVDVKSHNRWFWQRVSQKACLVDFWIAELDCEPVGQVRVDSNGEISFSVDAEFRGRGFGAEMVRLACQAASEHGRLKASVDGANEAGLRTLKAAGFVEYTDVRFLRWQRPS